MSGVGSHTRMRTEQDHLRKMSYCHCKLSTPIPWIRLGGCNCGEGYEENEWGWDCPTNGSWVIVREDGKTVVFHPLYSSGTAFARGDTPMIHNYHYYWEVKMLTDTYGTDIMVGMCSDKASLNDSEHEYKPLLGQDSESYGLSYKGELRHQGQVMKNFAGFCRGSIIGVRVDMWVGTLEFYINRKSQGISFYNLRRHKALFPVLCSTAAQSSFRLIYASSWRASLQQEALKTLQACTVDMAKLKVPPGLRRQIPKLAWLNLRAIGGKETRSQEENTASAADVRKEPNCLGRGPEPGLQRLGEARSHQQSAQRGPSAPSFRTHNENPRSIAPNICPSDLLA